MGIFKEWLENNLPSEENQPIKLDMNQPSYQVVTQYLNAFDRLITELEKQKEIPVQQRVQRIIAAFNKTIEELKAKYSSPFSNGEMPHEYFQRLALDKLKNIAAYDEAIAKKFL